MTENAAQRLIRRNVARGAELLDKQRRGWWRRIRLRDLHLDDARQCVLGQDFSRMFQRLAIPDGYGGQEAVIGGDAVWSPYGYGLKRLGIRGTGVSYGFDIPSSERVLQKLGYNGAAEFMRIAWADEVAARRRKVRATWPSSQKPILPAHILHRRAVA